MTRRDSSTTVTPNARSGSQHPVRAKPTQSAAPMITCRLLYRLSAVLRHPLFAVARRNLRAYAHHSESHLKGKLEAVQAHVGSKRQQLQARVASEPVNGALVGALPATIPYRFLT